MYTHWYVLDDPRGSGALRAASERILADLLSLVSHVSCEL